MKDILQDSTRGGQIFLLLDYDGTLVPIRKAPDLAVLWPSRRRLLEQLSQNAFVCIVSGRSLVDIQKLASIKNIAYIGNHGLEISYRGRRWIHPEAKRIKPILKDILERIRQEAGDWPGVLIEDKGLTGSIHYRRLAAPLPKKLRDIIEHEVQLKNRELKSTEGKKVLEIRPNIKWDKGRGVRELMRWLDVNEPALRIYIGDDQTDEDAFRALRRSDITILVGKRRDSHARSRLPNVQAVWKFLGALLPMTLSPPFTQTSDNDDPLPSPGLTESKRGRWKF
jgi:trehalose-phosphatase